MWLALLVLGQATKQEAKFFLREYKEVNSHKRLCNKTTKKNIKVKTEKEGERFYGIQVNYHLPRTLPSSFAPSLLPWDRAFCGHQMYLLRQPLLTTSGWRDSRCSCSAMCL